jgi:pimeloyl-ACP methyl ester carboxylesterase
MNNQTIQVPGASLSWSLIDLTPPWVREPPCIVMHHGIGSNRHIFDAWVPALMLTHRVLRFDMRGHGDSVAHADSPLTMDRLSGDLLAVMDAAGVSRGHLLGESIGATIALHAALRHPERVVTLTTSNGAHLGASIQAVENWRGMIEQEGMDAWSAFMMEGRFAPGAIGREAWEWFHRQQATADPRTVLRLLAALVGADLLDSLPGLRPPLMILHPDRSPFIPVPVIADLLQRVPGARLHVFGGARHGLPFSHAGACAALLRDFVLEHAEMRGEAVSTVDPPGLGH